MLLVLTGGAVVCSAKPANTARMTHESAPTPPSGQHVQVGYASWYGTPHSGHRTASGEPYDPQLLTAAHPSLPLHSTVRVTNLANGLSVDVRVNDRGPFRSRRVIDLSQRAAETIGLKRRGVAKVKVEPLPRVEPAAYHVTRR
jgi:rare lipoprotein A